ncbi:hypothetical protein Lal_00008581, partial [Lupinus albus]
VFILWITVLILETSVEVKQNTSGNVQEKESTNASQSEQKGCIPLTSQPEPKSGKALTSYVWRYFEKAGIVDGKEKARCLGCKKLLSCSTRNETSHLIRHVDNFNKTIKNNDIGIMLLDGGGGGLKKRKFDPKVNRDMISELIISHGLPFNIVEWRFEQHKNTKRTTSRGKKYDNEEDDDERDAIDIEDIQISHGGLESIVQSNE